MIRRLFQATWATLLLVVGFTVALDLWETLGRPAGRCPVCQARFPWNPRAAHHCAVPRDTAQRTRQGCRPIHLDIEDPAEGR